MRYPFFTKGDLDGFFGLAVDNLVQVLVIATLCEQLCGFTPKLIYSVVFPGIAISLLIGNLFYAFHAHYVARRDNNPNCTALPFGINTPSVFAYILFILKPVYDRYLPTLGQERAGELAWKIGLLACIGSGIIEFAGAFIGNWIRRVTPRAALLSALAAIGIIFIASPFAFQIFERPLVAMLPLFIVMVGYFAHVRFPLGLPSGLMAVLVGTILAWTIPFLPHLGPRMMNVEAVKQAASFVGVHTPKWCWADILSLMSSDRTLLWSYLGVVVPMGLINAIGSLQNIESAEAAGDRFSTGPCMAVNGICTIAAGLFGSCFPTTIYIGHPGWKALGARSGYSILNGLFFTAAFLLGLGALIARIIPMEAGMAIVLWIGIIIAAQSYEAVPTRHYPAVAIGFFPAVAMMAVLLVPQILINLGVNGGILPMINQHGLALESRGTDSWWPIGVYALAGANSGFVITCIIISALSVSLIDNRFKTAGIWCLIGAGMTLIGFQHAFRIEPGTLEPRELLVWQRQEHLFQGTWLFANFASGSYLHRAYQIATGYGLGAVLCFAIHILKRKGWFEDIVDVHGAPVAAQRRSSQISKPFDEEAKLFLTAERPKREAPKIPASRLIEHEDINVATQHEAQVIEKKQAEDPDVQRSAGEGMVVHPFEQAEQIPPPAQEWPPEQPQQAQNWETYQPEQPASWPTESPPEPPPPQAPEQPYEWPHEAPQQQQDWGAQSPDQYSEWPPQNPSEPPAAPPWPEHGDESKPT